MTEECGVEEIAAILEDETARTILEATSTEPMSASTLSDRCGVSEPTIYRRLEELRACDLVVEETELDTEGGHHRKLYRPNLDRVTVTLDEDGLGVSVERPESPADRFTRLVEGM